MKISESMRTNLLVAMIFVSAILFAFDFWKLSFFILLHIILWAVIEQSLIIMKSIRALVKILVDSNKSDTES